MMMKDIITLTVEKTETEVEKDMMMTATETDIKKEVTEMIEIEDEILIEGIVQIEIVPEEAITNHVLKMNHGHQGQFPFKNLW